MSESFTFKKAEPLAGLNPAQREAVLHHEGPMLVVAGAGSGKTRVLTTRIARLIEHHGVDPRQILAVTFTNKAAGEMRERIGRLLGAEPQGMWSGTFHAIGARLLRQSAALVGRTPNFTIYDEDDSLGVIKRLMEKHKIALKDFPPKTINGAISDAKNQLVEPREYQSLAADPLSRNAALVYNDLEGVMRAQNAVSFDDLLVLPVRIMEQHPERLKELQDRFQFILVDEYQDTNRAQYRFINLLAGKHTNVVVVGDDDQCLVRGTSIEMADGSRRPIEAVRVGDEVRSAFGSGRFGAARVLRTVERSATEGIEIVTRGGRRIVSTPEHTHFAGYALGVTPQMHFVYLMHRRGVGYRVGVTQVYTRGQDKPIVGFAQRLLQERADALWIVATHTSDQAARADEYLTSLRYQLPTIPFVARHQNRAGAAPHGVADDQATIDRIFGDLDTASGAARLLAERGLSIAHPHHRPRSRNSSRRNVVLTLCGDRRGARPMHRISMVGNDDAGRETLADLGLSVRSAKQDSRSWRHETASVEYRSVCETVERIAGRFDLNVFQVARLGRNDDPSRASNSLPFTPAGSVLPGMAMFDENGDYDIVATVRHVTLDEPVYDLDVENTHNFVANGIVTHNSIYGWRGADIRNILDFEKDFPSARVVRLEDNYRSSPQILELANTAIQLNTNRRGKTLRATRPSGERVTSIGALDERDEADWVVEEIATRRSGRDSYMLRDFAVLYRTNSQSRPMEEAMRKRNVPYRLIGAVRFYDRREIRDLMAYLKLVANPADNEAFRRAIAVPKRGLGDTTIEALADAAAREGVPLLEAAGRSDLHAGLRPAARTALGEFSKLLASLSVKAREAGVDEILRDVIDGVKYIDYLKAEGPEGADRVENVRELVTSAAETVSDEGGEVGLTPLDHFLQRATLIAGVDHLDPNADAVTMMTLHNAKGLEFPVVFLTGLEDGLFPLAKAFDDPTMLEEERRLFYVGITRAEKKLYLTYAEQRRRNGETMHSRQSQFLGSIPDGMLEYRKTVKARSMGRNFGSGGSYGSGRGFGANTGDAGNRGFGVSSAANRRPGTPVSTFGSSGWGSSSSTPSKPARREEPEDVSQDAPLFVVGARVKHKKFGSGTIAELSGIGRDAKARIDFDDEEVGRKTLVIAQANLERGDD